MLQMQGLCLDYVAGQARKSGFIRQFRNTVEYNVYMIESVIKRALELGMPGVVDFGAGHAVYNDKTTFEHVKSMLSKFKNIVLLLPTENLEESLRILSERSTGDYDTNREFILSGCYQSLATIVVYSEDKTPNQIAQEIVDTIEKRKVETARRQ